MRSADGLEALLRRDRAILLSGLVVICALSWAYILSGAGMGMTALDMTRAALFPHQGAAMRDMPMGGMQMGAGPMEAPTWTPGYAVLMVAMWWVMMIAMMLPSATPMVMLYGRTLRHSLRKGRGTDAMVPTAWFLAGYLGVWLAFSVAVVAVQALFAAAGLISPMMLWSENRWFSAAVLLVAALYQFSPLKHTCLVHCRAPAEYLSAHWRPGRAGALRMGLGHGSYCVGCCWPLMGLLFVGGVMNLLWIAGLALLVLVEKLAPRGRLAALSSGAVLLIWAALTLAV